jgi:hypothetical protein
MATQSTLTLYANADHTLRIDVKTEDGGATAQTMTGWALAFVVRRTDRDEPVVCSYTTAAGITIGNGDGTDDRATVAVADTDITHPAGNQYRWALWRTDAGSDIPLAEGPCVIRKAATQP